MTMWASPQDVTAAAAEWSDRIVQCRIYGHTWKPNRVQRTLNGLLVRQRCSRCTNHREQDMDMRGAAGPWRHLYAEGYLSKGMGRIGGNGRNILRLAAIRHLPITESED